MPSPPPCAHCGYECYTVTKFGKTMQVQSVYMTYAHDGKQYCEKCAAGRGWCFTMFDFDGPKLLLWKIG